MFESHMLFQISLVMSPVRAKFACESPLFSALPSPVFVQGIRQIELQAASGTLEACRIRINS
ncbi:unnamed protein product, partial [Nesidiocoris tenuis]